MAKLLKPLVVIVLLLAITALCLQAFVLFPKRTLIKERTLKHEAGLNRVVGTLRSSLDEEAQGQVPFSATRLKIDHADQFPQLDGELNRANSVAMAVVQSWEDTKVDLENTRQDLENTRAELENTKAQLEDARTQIVHLQDTIRSKDEEIRQQSDTIASLEEEKSSLESQLDVMNESIASMEMQVAQLDEEKNMLEILLAKCEGELGGVTMPVGTTAKIIYANHEWNFVIIDLGSVNGAQVLAEMIVHRGDNMIGKIQITAVRENVSIAEVLSDYQVETIKEGDHVLF